MLSKNNYPERLRKMEQKNERYSIRKFSAGAASVLIGFTFMGMANSQTVKADTKANSEPTTDSDPSHVAKSNTTSAKDLKGVEVVANSNNNANSNSGKETSQNSTQSMDTKADDQTQAVTTAKDNDKANKTNDEKAQEKNKEEKQAGQKTNTLDTSKENLGLAGRVDNSVSKAASDASALTKDAKEADQEAEKTVGSISNDALTKTATEEITYTAPEGGSFVSSDNQKSQTSTERVIVSASRSGQKDSVTGKVNYTGWTYTPADKQYAETLVPKFNGYTPSATDDTGQTINLIAKDNNYYIPSTPAFTGDGEPIDKKINIKYTADQAQANIKYIDVNNKNGQPVDTQTITGKTGERVSLSLTDSNNATKLDVPSGWEIASGSNYPTAITLTADSSDNQTVYVQHKTTTTVGGNSQDSDVYKQVEQNITLNKPDGSSETVHNHITFTRDKTVDEATNTTTYTDWKNVTTDKTTGQAITGFAAQNVARPGYTATATDSDGSEITLQDGKIPAVDNVTADTPDQNITVNYTPIKQVYTINYVTKSDNKTVDSQEVTGDPGQTVTYTMQVPSGYEFAPDENNQVPTGSGTVTFGTDGNSSTTVYVQAKVDDGRTDQNNTDLYRKVTETANITQPGETTPQQATATYSFYRTKDANGNYSEWKSNTTGVTGTDFGEMEVPTHAGYTVVIKNGDASLTPVIKDSKTYIPAISSLGTDGSPEDKTLTVTYEAQDAKRDINYVSTDGKTVSTQTLSGKTGDVVKLSLDGTSGTTKLDVPSGWSIVQGSNYPTSVPLTANVKPITVQVEHATTAENWETNPNDPNYVKTITEKITYTYPNSEPKVLTNTIKYYRTGEKDQITGAVTYSDWTPAKNADGTEQTSFAAIEFSAVNGYTAVYTDANGQSHTLTPNADGKVVVPAVDAPADGPSEYNLSLVYNNDKTGKPDDPNAEHTYTINYVDDSDKKTVVNKQTYKGKAGEKITVETKIPDKWQLAYDQNVPGGEFTFGSTDPEPATVYVTHKLDTVQGMDNKDNPDLYRTVTRTIAVEGADKNGTQTKYFSRNLTTDEVTGEKTYSDWTSDGDDYKEYELQTVDGQTPQATENGQTLALVTKDGKTYVPAESALVNGEPTDKTVNVKYVDNTATTDKANITVNYTNNGQTVGNASIQVTKSKSTNITPMVNSYVPSGYKVADDVIPAKTYTEDTIVNVPVVKYDPTTDTDTDSVVTQVINYVADGTTVGSQNLTNKVGTTYKVITTGTAGDGEVLIKAPEGYKLAQTSIDSPIVLHKQSQPINIAVSPITYSGKNTADAQEHPELVKTVTGIYKYNVYGQTSDSGEMPVSFYRTGSMDPKTGKMTYSAWQSNMVDKSTTLQGISVNNPREGYSIKVTTSTGQEITPTVNGDKTTISGVSMLKDGVPTDVTVNVDYINDKTGTTDDSNAKTTKTTIKLVDSSTGTVVASQESTGKSGTAGKVTVTVPSGYKLADGVTLPDTFKFADQDQTLTYNLVKDSSSTTTDPSKGNTSDNQDTEVTQVINYVDQATNKVVKTQSVTGKVGTMYQPILTGKATGNEVLIQAPENYDLSKQNINPITLAKDAEPISILVKAKTTPENWNDHKDDTNYYRTITQTVTWNIPGQDPTTNNYQVIYYRNGIKNDATGEITYDNWKAAGDKNSFPAHNVSIQPGYTPVVTDNDTGKQVTLEKNSNGDLEIPAMSTTPDTKDVAYTVNYEANTLSFNINYVDMANNKTISTQVVSGKPGEDVTITSQVPKNWQLVSDDKVPSGTNGVPTHYEFGDTAPSDITAYIEPKVIYGADNQDNPDLYKTVTGKVTVTLPGEQPEVKNQSSIIFYRNSTYNPTTGKYEYSAWKSNLSDGSTTFPGVTLSAIDGYTINVKASDGQTITPELQSDGHYRVSGGNALASGTPEDVNVDVTYVKNGSTTPTTDPSKGDQTDPNKGNTSDDQTEVTRDIQYVADGHVVGTQTLKGKAGTTYQTVTKGSAGDGQVLIKAPEGYTIAQTSIDGVIALTKDAAPVQIQVSPITEYGSNDANKSNPDLYRTVTANYTITGPDGSVSHSTASLAFYRDRTMDPATNSWKYTDWKSNVKGGQTTFGPLTQNVVKGYTIKVTTSTGQEIAPTISGDSASISGISALKDGQPTDVDVTVKYINDKTGTTTKPADPNATYTKLINYVTKDGQKVETQTVTGKAGETVNITLQVPDGYQIVSNQQVPSQVTFGNTDEQPSTVVVEKKTTTDPDKEYTYTINYDYNGKTVGTQIIKGKSGQTENYTITAPDNYQLVPNADGKVPGTGSLTFGNEDGSTTVAVEPKVIQGNTKGNEDNSNVYRIVTATYNVTVPGSKTDSHQAKLSFYRDATYNPATNEYDYSAWKSNEQGGATTFSPITVPEVEGYTIKVTTDNGQTITPVADGDKASISGVSGLKDGQPTNVIVNVDYINNKTGKSDNPGDTSRSLTVNYVYNNQTVGSQTVGSQTVSGKVGETTTYTYEVPENYQLIPNGDQITTGGNVTFGSGQIAPVTVNVEPKVIQGNVKGNQDNPDVYKTVQGTITVNIPGEKSNTQGPTSISFYRTATYNPATGKYDYSAWKSNMENGTTTFGNVSFPSSIEGYTLSIKATNGATITPEVNGDREIIKDVSLLVNGEPTNVDVTVDYINNKTGKPDNPGDTSRTFTINYVNKADNQTIDSQTVSGNIGQTVTYTLNVPAGYEIVSGQSIPGGKITFGTGQIAPATVYVEKQDTTKPDNPSDPTAKTYTQVINYVSDGNTIKTQNVTGKAGQTAQIKLELPQGYKVVSGASYPSSVTFGEGMKPIDVQIEANIVTENGLETKNPDLYKVITRTITFNMPASPEAQMLVSLAESAANNNTQSQSITLYRTKSTNEATGETSYSKWQSNTVDSSGKPVTEFEAVKVPEVSGYEAKVTGADVVDTANGQEIPAQSVLTAAGEPISDSNINITVDYVANGNTNPNKPATDTDKEYTYTINYDYNGQTIDSQVIKGKTGTQANIRLDVPSGYQVVAGTTVPTMITISNKDESISIPVEKTTSTTPDKGNQGTDDQNDQVTQVIDYVDQATNKVVATQSITGKAGSMYQPIIEGTAGDNQVLIKAPNHYALAKQVIHPITLTKGAKAISILVRAETTPENWNDHQNDTNYYRTITQSVTWNIPGEQQQTTTSEVIYYRNGTLNEATGEVTYGDWKAAGDKDSFKAHNVSLAPGYTPVVTDANGKQVELTKDADGNLEIPAVSTTPDSQDTQLFVNYTADSHKMVINYVNNSNKQVVSTQTVTGKTGETVDYTLDIPANWEIVPGTSYPLGQVSFGTKDQATQTVLIQPKTIDGQAQGNQDNPDVFRTVSDTVVVNYPGKQPQSLNGQLSFYRTATMDPATGKWTYSDWQSNMSDKSTTFPSITVSTIDGYTIVAQASDGRQITPLISGKSATISGISGLVNGQPQDVTIVVNYKNDSTGQEDNPINPDTQLYTYTINYMDGETKVGTQSVTGPQGATTRITAKLPAGYKLANGVNVPTSYTFQNSDQSLNIAVVKDASASDNPDQTNEVTQVINYVYNGQVVASQKLTGNVGDSYKVVTSGSANDGEVLIKAPNYYELAQTSISSPIVLAKDAQPIAIQVAPVVYDGRDANEQSNPDLYKIVTGKYEYNVPGQSPQSSTTQLAFYRTAQVDPATGKLTYSDWKSNVVGDKTTFGQVTVPVVNGYTIKATASTGQTITPEVSDDTATISGVSGLTNGVPTDVTVTIDYVNNNTGKPDTNPSDTARTYTINFINKADNKNVGSQEVTGKVGQTVSYTVSAPNGYQIVNGQQTAGTITFGSDQAGSTTVYVEKKGSTSTDTPTTDQTTTVSGLKDQSDPDLYREITQTITITGPDGKTQSVDNHLIFYRDKTTNKETGKSTYTAWKSNSASDGQIVSDFSEQEVPTVKGYDVLAMKNDQQINLITKDGKVYLPAQAGLVDGSPEDQTITISYVAQNQSVKINFVDSSQKVIATQTVTGKTGEKIQLNLEVPKNWQLVPNTTVPTSVTIGADDNKDINVQIEHKLDVVDGRNDQSNPNLFKQVTRTIIMNWPGQKAGQSTASLAFYRVETTDEVTGKTTYTDWQDASDTTEYPEQSVTMPGYTASSDNVALITKDGKQYVPATEAEFNSEGTPIDSTIVVNYVGNEQKVQINYVSDGETVSSQTVSGQTGQTVAVALEIPSGYEVADGASYPSQITFGSDTKPITVAVSKIPAGQGRQTINYVDPEGQVVGNQYVTGTVGQTVDVTAQLPINWKLADGATTPTSVTIKDTDTPIEVKVVSTTVQVDPSDPQTPGTEIDDAHGQTYPNGLTENDLNKTVTRTVNIINPVTGKTATTVQTVKFTRTATVQVATGEVTYTDWTADGTKNFPAIEVPTIDGYTASGKVSEIAPSADYGNQTLTITYTKNNASSDDDKKPDNEQYKPDVSSETSITTNGDLKPEDVIKNASDMPNGTTFEWTDPEQVAEDLTKPGTYKDVGVKITYPDKTTTTVTTNIVVSDKQEASYIQQIIFEDAETQKVIHSFKFTGPLTDGKATLSADKLKTVIESLFKVIQAGGDTYKNATIVSLPTKDIEVTGDENAPIIVMVGFEDSQTDSDKYTPEVNTDNTVTTNGKLDPKDVVKNADKMPNGTTFEWGDPKQVAEDLTKPGTYKDVGVTITYPDKSTTTVKTTIVVSDSTTPGSNTNTNTNTNNGNSSSTDNNGGNTTVVPDNNSGSNTSNTTTNGSTTNTTNSDSNSSSSTDQTQDTSATTDSTKTDSDKTTDTSSDEDTDTSDSDEDYDDGDDSDEVTPTTHHSHKSSSHGVASLAQARKHANNAQWLANHGYIVTVGPHGQVLSYRKSADGKGKIITAQVHGQSLANNTGASTSALQKAGLAGVKSSNSSNSTLPQTGEKNDEAAAIGLGLISAAGLLGLAGAEKKRKRD